VLTTDEFGCQINAPLVRGASQILAGFGRHIDPIGDIANWSAAALNAAIPAAAVSDCNRAATLGNYLRSVRPRDHTCSQPSRGQRVGIIRSVYGRALDGGARGATHGISSERRPGGPPSGGSVPSR
jgi:hypothetical protein